MEKKLDKDCNAFVAHSLTGKIDSVKINGMPTPSQRGFSIAGWHTRTEKGDIIHYLAGNYFQHYRVTGLKLIKLAQSGRCLTWANVEPMLNEPSEMMKG